MAFFHILRVALVSALLLTSVSGDCSNPRVRREWRSISSAERAGWIEAVKCLTKLPHDPKIAPTVNTTLSLIPQMNSSGSYFDDFSYVHMDLNVLIHQTGFFLPWHRLYVQTFEDELTSKCGYNGVQPYWDWTQDAADFYHSTIFSNSTSDGLGSWGDPENDFQISTGGLKDVIVAYPTPHHIRRNFTLRPISDEPSFMVNTSFTQAIVDYAVDSFAGNYTYFQAYLDSISGVPGLHTGPHAIMAGDMAGTCPFGLTSPACYSGQKWSTNDPLFFLHHAMVDKVWYDWQHKNSSNEKAFGGGSVSWQVNSTAASEYPTGAPPFLNLSSVIPGDGLWENVTVQDVMDTVGGKLCYTYA